MKKPKISFEIWPRAGGCGVAIYLDEWRLVDDVCISKKAAREWAKDWCRTVGAALMEKGK